jgi:hypothetical protein
VCDGSGGPVALPAKIEKVADDIGKNWGREPLFVDLGLLGSEVTAADGRHPLAVLAGKARQQGLRVVPVTSLERSPVHQEAVASAARQDGNGVCLRLRGDDLTQNRLPDRLYELLSILSTDPSAVDLLVDLGTYDEDCPTFQWICRQLPDLFHWRTFTIVMGSFPKDLTGFKVGQHLLPRWEWKYWRDQVMGREWLPRAPTFGDYTIQHPVFSEPPAMASFSASIRYTTTEDWVIMRGESVFKDGGPGFAQWPANATLLCRRVEFCGADFSDGDRYICERSVIGCKTGNAETWLRAGLNHHMTFVARQVANLPDPVAGAERDIVVGRVREPLPVAYG